MKVIKQILMTTIISICLCAFMLGLLWFCSSCSSENTKSSLASSVEETQAALYSESTDDYFIEVGRKGNHFFWYDRYTKVMYTQYFSPKGGSASLTVMVNSGGKPLTYDEWRSFQEK